MNTNLDQIMEGDFKSTYDAAEQSYNNVKADVNKLGGEYTNYLNNLPNTGIDKKVEQYKPKYFNITWRMYRTASLILIFLMFFVLRYFALKFEKKNADKYVISVYNIFSVFLLINICIACFRFVFTKYRETVIGKKGARGIRGKRGNQGINDSCDITKPKIAKFRQDSKNKEIKEIIVDNKIIDTKINNSYKYEWTKIGSSVLGNQVIGNGKDDDTNKDPIFNNTNSHKPIIGAMVNFNKDSEKINKLQYLVDKNKVHDTKSHNIDLFGKATEVHKDGYGSFNQDDVKGTFQCPPNSAIYKIEGAFNNDGLKGVKYYCADIQTGKNVKSYDANNNKKYGASFGVEPVPNNKQYYYDKIECSMYEDERTHSGNSLKKFYPSFISNISSDENNTNNNKSVQNIKVGGCSIYSPT